MFKRKIRRPSNSEIKKRRIIKALALSIVFIAILSLTYTLTNINTKRLKGESDYPEYLNLSCEEETACYQAGFRNGNLYQRVIDSYNEYHGENLSYTDLITDEQLLSIDFLIVNEGNIDDATGIEKLLNLRVLELSDNNLASIDVSNLTKLEALNLSGNNLSSIDLSSNAQLETLHIADNNIESIDLSNNPRLHNLSINYNTFSSSNINIMQMDELYVSAILLKGEVLNIYDEFDLAKYVGNNIETEDENIVSIEGDIISANNVGATNLYYESDSNNVYFIITVADAMESNKYDINYEERYFYTGIDNNEEIINNLYYEHEFLDMVEIDKYYFTIKNNQISMSIIDPSTGHKHSSKQYKLGRIDLSSYEINEKEITVNGVFNYEEVPHDNVELEYSNNTLIVKDLNGNEVDRYTVVGNNDPRIIDPEPINPGNNNGNPAPNNDDENNNTNNNNQNTNDNSKIEESTTNNAVIEKEDITSKKTTLNKFEKNAKTYDDIVKYFIIGGIAIILIIGVIIYTKRKK